MDIQGYFTKKGLALSAKLAAGATLTITKVVAGAGQTANPMAATSLPLPKQTLAVNTPTRSENTATIPVTLAAATAEEAYTLTELGVYARDPDEGEILYKVYRLGGPVDISPASCMVLRFYLAETVSQDLEVTVSCSPAGLITEEEFAPVREKVQGTAVTYREVTLDAAALPAFLRALPRLMTEDLTILVSGTLTETVEISGLHGSGSLFIRAASQGDCTVKSTISVSNCSIRVVLQNLAFEDEGAAAATYYQAVVLGINVRQLAVENCTFTGNGTGKAVMLTNLSSGWLSTCSIQNFESAACAWGDALLSLSDVSASGNTYGANIYRGGIILLPGFTPELLGGTVNINDGGLIAKSGKLL